MMEIINISRISGIIGFVSLVAVISAVGPSLSGSASAQTLTATYVEFADSADYYIGKKRWSDAERMIIKALRHEPANPSNWLLWSNLGQVRDRMDNYTGALEAYDIGVTLAPRSTVLLTNRAATLMALNRNDEALKNLDNALQIDTTLQWPRKMRGLLNAAAGNRSDAISDFDFYESKWGKDVAIQEARGDFAASEGEADEAMNCYAEAVAMDKENPDLHEKFLLAACMFGKVESVAPVVADALRLWPRRPNLYLVRAMLSRAKFLNDAMDADLEIFAKLGGDPKLVKTLFPNKK
ncbi:MAG: tetratricopeptide repeat protein [Muribaculaceae bacterium]|nr:tetratricopeptide repeat protein [Muribaculaceae bacterium]